MASQNSGSETVQRTRVEEWRQLIINYWKPLVTTIHPLSVFMKARFCDPDAHRLQEELLDLQIHDRNKEGAEKLLQWLQDDQDYSPDDLLARWQLFKMALEKVHPILHEMLFDNTYQQDEQEHQKLLITFFMDNITRIVDPMHVTAKLYKTGLMSQGSLETLRSIWDQKGPTMAAIYMVCNIHRQRSDWYELFLQVLMEEGYSDLVKEVDVKVHDKIEKWSASSTSIVGEASVLKAHGEAHQPGAVNYAGAPSPEGRDDHPSCSEERGEETSSFSSFSEGQEDSCGQDSSSLAQMLVDSEQTEVKTFLHSDPAQRSAQMSCMASENSDDDGDGDDDFFSCGETDDEDAGREDGGQLGRMNVSDNLTQSPKGKELKEKNIEFTGDDRERMMMSMDDSNEEWRGEGDEQALREVEPEPLILRSYQEELAREGLKGKNVIIVAPTGSGKTHVALKIIQNHLGQVGSGVKKVVFLVNQLALAQQQYDACRKYLTDWRIKLITGNAVTGGVEKVPFKHLMMRADILVMTAQVLVNALYNKEVEGVCVFSLVVFDECHHTSLMHPFNSIMHYYMDVKFRQERDQELSPPQQLPQVVGLTASVGVGKAGDQEKARKHIVKLCAHLNAQQICTVHVNREQLALHSNDPQYEQHICNKRPNDKFQELIEQIMHTIEQKMEKSKYLMNEDLVSLKEKLKVRPRGRGTAQYTGWVAELVRLIAMLDDAETRRFFDAGRVMLKFYNEALVINDECDTQEALEFLQRQMNEVYDPLSKRVRDMDVFVKELFDKNLPVLTVASSAQLDTNPKLITLEKLILKAFKEQPESRAIVFVKTRDLSTALLKWMMRKPQIKALRPSRMVGAGPSTDRGGMTKNQQVDVMEFFRTGDHQVLIATSVAEEGLDIRKCNLVIRYNHVSNEIAMVQARGRARAENSQFMTLASHDQGVQAKEEVNFIREMMMHEAIKRLQSEMKNNFDAYWKEVEDVQKEEKSKRDIDMAARHGRRLRQGEVVFRCRNCDAYAFVSSDVRKIENIHHVVIDLDYHSRNIERPGPTREYGQIQTKGRVLCKDCGEDWGPVLIFQQIKFPCIRLEGFRLVDEHGRKDIPKRWKQVQIIIDNLEPEELLQYREDAIAHNYVDLY